MKGNPHGIRYTIENVYANRKLEYVTEQAYLKNRAGEKSRAKSTEVSFGTFINEVFGEWVESVEEKELAARILYNEIAELQNEVNGVYDEALILDVLFDAAHGKDADEAALRILDILTINIEAAQKAARDEGYDEGYDNGYNIALDLTSENDD